MKLTEKQERRLAQYVGEVETHLKAMGAPRRDAAVAELRARIERELRAYGDSPPHNKQLDTVLRHCGDASQQAARLMGDGVTAAVSARQGRPDRVWLGICALVANQLEIEVSIVRIIAVLLGLVPFLLPFLLLLYIGAYFVVFHTSEEARLPAFDIISVAGAAGRAIGAVVILYVGTAFVVRLIAVGYARLLGQTLRLTGNWGWLNESGPTLFFWSLATLAPLAVLSALPVKPGWPETLRKVVNAGLALYAVLLSFGVACILAGIALEAAKMFSGSFSLENLLSGIEF